MELAPRRISTKREEKHIARVFNNSSSSESLDQKSSSSDLNKSPMFNEGSVSLESENGKPFLSPNSSLC